MNRRLLVAFFLALSATCAVSVAAAELPHIAELRKQRVDGVTYFHLRLDPPANLRLPVFDTNRPFSEADRRNFARLPRLAPQDGSARAVYYRHKPTQPSLSFCGQATGDKAELILLYPVEEVAADKKTTKASSGGALARAADTTALAEARIELDFAKAKVVPAPVVDPQDQHIHRDDLRSLWALHQAAHFAVLETQVLDFPFYSFAREATGRKYGVVSPAWVRRQHGDPRHRLYEITTGADAIAETLQLHRMMQPEARSAVAERTIAVTSMAGVTVPEQPWERLLEGRRPTIEPLARLIPRDNYYLYFHDLGKLIEAGDLMDQWGTSILRVYEMKSRDYQLRERYERQLCLRSTVLGKTLGPALVKGVAVTGNDPYVREGTDITVIFHVTSRPLFLSAVEGFLEDARRQHGDEFAEHRDAYHGATIERYVTPLREVSLHRSTLTDDSAGEFVIYSNSPAGVRRAIDAYQGRAPRLADSGDFRYMRTVFSAGEKEEDGFIFLSDAFIRQSTSPASRIKEKRRLEALTSLYMTTNAAMFHAWETGKLPADHAAALRGAGLRGEDVAVPDGKGCFWDAERQVAVSDVYNTIHFATPLVELPIDKVTTAEAEEYARFHDEYTKLWRTYFDPIGMRLSLADDHVRIETHILPLAASGAYRSLRELTRGGNFRFDPLKGAFIDLRLGMLGEGASVAFHVDGNAMLRQMVELLIRWETEPAADMRRQYDQLFWKVPQGITIRDESDGRAHLADAAEAAKGIAGFLRDAGLMKDEPEVITHKDVAIHRVAIAEERYREIVGFLKPFAEERPPLDTIITLLPTQEPPPAIYIAGTSGAVHATASLEYLKKLIDQTESRKEAEKPTGPRSSNAALYLSPANARDAANLLLEYEGHHVALLNNQVWNSFYECGLLPADATDTARNEAARRFYGFLPVSADGSAYHYDRRLAQVVNRRHGTHARPQRHSGVEASSELGKLLDEIKAVRAEVQFQENGLHAVLRIERR